LRSLPIILLFLFSSDLSIVLLKFIVFTNIVSLWEVYRVFPILLHMTNYWRFTISHHIVIIIIACL
jgi:hypothetical protein